MTSDGYALADVAFEPERERLDILESLNDPASVAWLTRLGISDGWRCLDVGAGGGSVARWMAERVGANGTVVAADMDTRFLRALDLPNVEIRQLDILEDDIETDHYDLVHARFLLMHVSSPERALAKMVAAIKPGGWLLVEDGDYTNFAAVDRDHALSAVFDATFRKEMAFYVASLQLDPLIGRKLPALVKRLELSDVDHEDKNWVRERAAATSESIGKRCLGRFRTMNFSAAPAFRRPTSRSRFRRSTTPRSASPTWPSSLLGGASPRRRRASGAAVPMPGRQAPPLGNCRHHPLVWLTLRASFRPNVERRHDRAMWRLFTEPGSG